MARRAARCRVTGDGLPSAPPVEAEGGRSVGAGERAVSRRECVRSRLARPARRGPRGRPGRRRTAARCAPNATSGRAPSAAPPRAASRAASRARPSSPSARRSRDRSPGRSRRSRARGRSGRRARASRRPPRRGGARPPRRAAPPGCPSALSGSRWRRLLVATMRTFAGGAARLPSSAALSSR